VGDFAIHVLVMDNSDTDVVHKSTTDLVRERNLLFNLSRCLLETMRMASFIPGSPGSPPPAGSSSDTMNDLDARITPSASLTAALLAILGSFSSEGGDEANIARLDSEINELILGMADVSGGDSRHHGRSAISKNTGPLTGNGKDIATHRYLLERTAALVLPTLDPSHTVLSHRRYSVCISDLKCVLNVNGMARYFASLPIDQKIRLPSATSTQGKSDDYSTTISTDRGITSDCPLNDWIQVLSLAQQMDGQMWRPWVKGHVESEPKGWVGAFNASISLSSLFERLLSWDDTDPSPIKNCNLRSLSCVELTHYILTVGLLRWQRSEMLSYRPTKPPSCHPHPPEYALSPASLPFSTVASAHGSVLAMAAIPLPQIAVWSFHLPLHRFAASCIREVSRRNDNAGESGLAALLDMLFAPPAGENVSTQLRLNTLFVRGLMEFPAIVLSR